MRSVCFEPFLAENILYLSGSEDIIGIPDNKSLREKLPEVPVVSSSSFPRDVSGVNQVLAELSSLPINFQVLKALAPEAVFTALPSSERKEFLQIVLQEFLGAPCALYNHNPVRIEDIFTMFTKMGEQLKHPDKGRATVQKMRAQIMDWGSNFYDRMKNKRVTFITSLDPLELGGRWIPDMIRLGSGTSQTRPGSPKDVPVKWSEVIHFNPDVIVVSLKGKPLKETLLSFKTLQDYPGWEKIFAVKRGDVYFADGEAYFNTPSVKLLESVGVLFSALAGFESGYITERDSFYKLRWLELHQHRLKTME